MEGNGSLCILCCYYFPHVKTEPGENPVEEEPFLQFCQQLLPENKETIVDLTNLKSSGQPVCPSCVEQVGEVSKQRRETVEVEELLIKQQLEVVITMRRLQDQIQRLQNEMKRMEDTVKNSDVAVLDRVLEGEEMEGCRSAIVMLRNKILTASGQIENFGASVAQKLPVGSKSGGGKAKKKKAVNPLDFLEMKMQAEGNLDEEEMIDLDELLGDDSNDAEYGEDIFDEDYQQESSIGTEDDYADSDFNLSDEDDGEKSKAGETVIDNDNVDNDLGLDPLAPPPKKKKKKWKKKRKYSDFSSAVQDMSDFKGNIVKRILTLKEKKEKRDLKEPPATSKAPDYLVEDPSKNYAIDYDPLTDKITLGHVELLLNDHLKSFTCTACGHVIALDQLRRRTSTASDLLTSIFFHVLGKHLEAFKCAQCGRVLTTRVRYRYHIKAHQKEYVCLTCGKELASTRSLSFHNWNTHMTEEERKIAVANGQKDPYIWLNKKKEREKQRLHQCPTCGKGFQNSFFLKQHLETHQDRDDREKIVCPKCGKHLLKTGWDYHSKVACADVQNLFYCEQCPEDKRKPYKSKRLLKVHVNRCHTVHDVTIYCDVCGKGCKTKTILKAHMRSHSDARPYHCQKGCGANYKESKHCKRHELKCEGPGGSWKGPRSTKSNQDTKLF